MGHILAQREDFANIGMAQRIPVHVRIDDVSPDVRLVAGITATVRIASP